MCPSLSARPIVVIAAIAVALLSAPPPAKRSPADRTAPAAQPAHRAPNAA